MRLVAQLLSGRQVDLEVSAEELACQVAGRAAQLLNTGRLQLITQTSVALPSWITVSKVGLREGELLTALVQRDIAGCVHVDLSGGPPDVESVRQAVEAVNGPYAVKLGALGADDGLEEVPWAVFSGAEELLLSGLTLSPRTIGSLVKGLKHFTKLRKVGLSAHIQSADSFVEFVLLALPTGLEELDVGLFLWAPRAPPQVMNFATGVPPLKYLRSAQLVDIFPTISSQDPAFTQLFMAALPNTLEKLVVHMVCLPSRCLVQHFPRMRGLKRLTLSGNTAFDDLLTCVKALPPGLAELDMGGCRLGYDDARHAAPIFTMSGDLAEVLQRFTQLRLVVCPRGEESQRQSYQQATAVLLALPRGLEVLGLPLVLADTEEEIEALEMGLRSFPRMKIATLPMTGRFDRSAWARMLQALPDCLEHLEFGLSHDDSSALDEAVADQLKHLPNLRSVCVRSPWWSTASLAALPQTVEKIFFKGVPREQDVRALRARLTEPKLAQLLRTNIFVNNSGGPEVTSEMFKAWLANG